MGRIIKVILWIVGGFIAVFAVAAIALTLFFDPNDFREDISTAVRDETGRELNIEGDISLSIFPWLAVEVGRTTLGDAPGFGDEPMLTFERASFSVRLLPALLSQEIRVGAADLEGLTANLKVDANGRTNWEDLASAGEAEAPAAEESAESSGEIDINRIDISGATISYTNTESNEKVVFSDVGVSIGRLTSDGSPVPFEASLNFDIRPAALSGDLSLSTELAYDSEAGIATLADLIFEGGIEGVASIPTRMRVATDEMRIDTAASSVDVEPLEMSMLGLDINADVEPFTYDDRVTPKATVSVAAFSPKSLMQLFDVEVPVTADPNALSLVIVDATAQLTPGAIEMTGVTIKLDDTTFTGALSVPRETSGTYQLDLSGDSIELARYMSPAEEGEVAEAGESVPVEIPVDLIRPLNARGSVKLAQASLGAIVFENIELGLNAGGGQLRMHPISSQFFGGGYNGDVRIDVTGEVPVISVNENIEGVNLADLGQAMYGLQNVSGSIEGSFKLSGRGRDTAEMQRHLNGTMSFELSDGAFEGTDIWHQLRLARAKLKGEEPPDPVLPARTEFTTVRATSTVTNGVMRNDDLFAELPFMQLTGGGDVDLPAATIDYSLEARFLNRPEFASQATPEELEDFTKWIVPLKISGPLASPSVRPDLEALLRQRAEEEIKDKVRDKLKDKLGDLFGQ